MGPGSSISSRLSASVGTDQPMPDVPPTNNVCGSPSCSDSESLADSSASVTFAPLLCLSPCISIRQPFLPLMPISLSIAADGMDGKVRSSNGIFKRHDSPFFLASGLARLSPSRSHNLQGKRGPNRERDCQRKLWKIQRKKFFVDCYQLTILPLRAEVSGTTSVNYNIEGHI